MNVWPVLVREARESSKRRGTHGVRLIAVLVAGTAAVGMGLNGELVPGNGAHLFGGLNRAVFLATWFLVPMMAADSLSRERREGTLGLLFLTPLRSMDIVMAKGGVHGLRGMTLWLAMVPVFTLPVLLGGVPWQQVLVSMLHNLSALMLALAAGVVASAGARQWRLAMVRAMLLAGVFCCGQALVAGTTLYVAAAVSQSLRSGQFVPDFPGWEQLFQLGWDLILVGERFTVSPPGTGWGGFLTWLLAAAAASAALSGLFALFLLGWAAWRVRSTWQEHPASGLRRAVERGFTTPILGRRLLDGWLRRSLSRNPVGWLEQRSWAGRLVMFGWLAAVIGVLSGVAGHMDVWVSSRRRYDVDWIELLVAFPLLFSMAATAAGSFRRERETGVLELLLVSPFKEAELVRGRLRGLYAQFLPSIVLLVVGWTFLLSWHPTPGSPQLGRIAWFLVWAFSIPNIGLFCSLRLSNYLAALLSTLALAWAVPGMVQIAFRWLMAALGSPGVPVSSDRFLEQLLRAVVCVVVAVFCRQELIRQLERRRFEFNQGVT